MSSYLQCQIYLRNYIPAINEPFRLALGKNFASSAHVDNDLGYTFSGSFSTELGKQGNGFIFPPYKLRLSFPEDVDNINLFCFNPKESPWNQFPSFKFILLYFQISFP